MEIHCSLKKSEQFNGTKVVLTQYDLSVRRNHLGLTFWVVAYGRFSYLREVELEAPSEAGASTVEPYVQQAYVITDVI